MSYQRLADSDSDCLAQSIDKVKPMLRKVAELKANWHPTGYYTPQELLAISKRIFNDLAGARKAITSVLNGTNGDTVVKLADRIGDAQLDLQRYINTAQTAKPNALVEAPDFKESAINAIYQVAYVTGAAIFIECESWPIRLITDIASVMVDLGDEIKAIAGAILDAAKEIAKVPEKIISLVETVVKIAAIGGAVYIAYELFGKPGKSGSRR